MDTGNADSSPIPLDCLVIGAGVVGLAIGRALCLKGREVVVVDAAEHIGSGISSRNSEVIHAGIYYPPGSLKALFCVQGKLALYAYCESRNVEHRKLGKLIVATTAKELPILDRYLERGKVNGVDDLRLLTRSEAQALEPQVRCAAAILSPSTGIIDSHGFMSALQADIEDAGGVVSLASPVTAGRPSDDGMFVECGGAIFSVRTVVNAAGLDAPEVSRALGLDPSTIPAAYLAKGHYFYMSGTSPFQRLVYPVAEAAGLGIHVTLDLAGRARFGPDVQWVDRADYDVDSALSEQFAAAIARYYPKIDRNQLLPAYSGIRPKISAPGAPAADFLIQGPAVHQGRSIVTLYGIESPGLTSSLAIAEYVANVLQA